ncbi:hypothetical protein C3007_11015 [Avibacterium gallinarum]|uniref:Putative phage regulatory protein Rha family n=1 Tax=Avibacterium gallinarum TaxID=755 RepID=A0A379AZS9_AVIGA|nr:Rha family transcriptional regulator [Avibacterium gallinarum]POY43325.1 hypothetical protein C3007_11015 [Avibacterium gallinarum]TDP27419.1 Rha family phage regulatory protein [Avibacterium gallinarum]SUB27342.1 putative phage regulatory protein Rha family [Avibacterium gallinarum]
MTAQALENTLESAVFPKLFHRETVAMTDSLKVAEYFGKRHDNLLQRIENLGCSKEFNALNFKAVKYTDSKGEKRPMFLMTQDGFTLLAMGFTGKKAMQFKEAYIKKFNQMKSWITSRANLKNDQRRLNDAIKFSIEKQGKDDPHAYSRENNLVYCVALGMSKKKWLAMHGYPKDADTRQFLTESQLKLVDELLSENAVMIKLGFSYSQRKAQLIETTLHHFRQAQGANQ